MCVGDIEFDGFLDNPIDGESDKVELNNCQDFNTPNRRFRTPFDGQAAYFHLDMSDYADTASTAQITEPLQFIRSVTVTNGGNPGDYNAGSPPVVTASLPEGPESIIDPTSYSHARWACLNDQENSRILPVFTCCRFRNDNAYDREHTPPPHGKP